MSEQQPGQPSEEELRAAYEEQLSQLRVEDVVLQTVVSLLNLGGRKAGLAPGTEDERDPEQVGMAVEAARNLLPLIEEQLGPDGAQIREAISQLQIAYVRIGGQGPAAQEDPPQGGGQAGGQGGGGQQPPQGPGGGRLWVPGQ